MRADFKHAAIWLACCAHKPTFDALMAGDQATDIQKTLLKNEGLLDLTVQQLKAVKLINDNGGESVAKGRLKNKFTDWER